MIGLPTPNITTDGSGFYVSYNNADTDIYGDVTTALVIGQMERFYILTGDHREGYMPLISLGLEACFDYYKANIATSHSNSDNIEDMFLKPTR